MVDKEAAETAVTMQPTSARDNAIRKTRIDITSMRRSTKRRGSEPLEHSGYAVLAGEMVDYGVLIADTGHAVPLMQAFPPNHRFHRLVDKLI